MTLIPLVNMDKIKWLSSCFRITDNPLHKSTHVGSGSLNTYSQVPSLFDPPANRYGGEGSRADYTGPEISFFTSERGGEGRHHRNLY